MAGIFHFSNDEMRTKYDMAVIMGKSLGLSTAHLVADPTAGGANRPQDARLDCSRVHELGIVKQTPFEEGIQRVLKPFVN